MSECVGNGDFSCGHAKCGAGQVGQGLIAGMEFSKPRAVNRRICPRRLAAQRRSAPARPLGPSAAAETADALAAAGAGELALTVVHRDFAEWNVHYDRGRLAGVIDFGLAQLDSRPYELAMARAHRSPEVIDAYRAGLCDNGCPLTGLEETAIEPVNHAARLDMIAWQLDHGQRTGDCDLATIERQFSSTGTASP
jgi:Ser/Thr protein kinase RdoA (MazF antagonist)